MRLKAVSETKKKSVLVVEDNPVQRESLSKLIQDKDVEVVCVGTGEEALETLRTRSFDCVILDLGLPDMSGFKLVEQISEKKDTSYPPVIVYTGKSLTKDEEERLRRYSESVIIKGAKSPERLLSEVTLFLHKIESEMPIEQQKILKDLRAREKIFEGRQILVVDDDVRNVFALTSALEQKGAKVLIARNGKEALKRLSESPGIELVLMDIMMPEMNGYTAIREIRKNAELKKLPIIAITAKAMKDDKELCLQSGANDYLAKPIDVAMLTSLIQVWLPRAGRV